MSELDFDPEFVKQKMFDESLLCYSTQQQFIDRITDQQAYEYLNEKREREKKEYQYLIEEKKKEIEELTKKLQKLQFT